MSFKNQVVKSNYHTHMYLCRHASGTVEDYVKEAIKLGFQEIGMSDHAPWIELIDRSVRMEKEDYPIYLKELEESIKKYSNKIRILKGLEIEYFKNADDYYKKLLKDMDYLTLGQHYIEKEGKLISIYHISSLEDLVIYKDTVIEAMNTGYFKFISHPDIFLYSTEEVSSEILELAEELIIAAKEKNIPLELNANGIRKGKIIVNGEERYRYPRLEFWKLVKKHNARCILSSDAHKPEYLFDEAMLEAQKFLEDIHLEVEEVLDFN